MEAAALILAGLLIAAIVIPSVRLGIGPMPSSKGARAAVAGLLERLPPDLPVYEFGAGWGGMVRAVARSRPDTPVTGVEASWLPFAVASIAAYLMPIGRLSMRLNRFERLTLDRPAVIVCYLHPAAMTRLADWVQAHPVEAVVAVNFSLPGAEPDARVGAGLLSDGPVYLYRFPSKERTGDPEDEHQPTH